MKEPVLELMAIVMAAVVITAAVLDLSLGVTLFGLGAVLFAAAVAEALP